MGRIARRNKRIKKLRYIPKLSRKEIEENHKISGERISLYRKRGLDTLESRRLILEKAYPLKGNILEVGTGTGHTTVVLAKAGDKIISIDIDAEQLKIAALNLAYENALSSVTFYVMDGSLLRFANGSFQNVICIDLFHHIRNIDKMLSEIDRVLCEGGKAALADFNKSGMEMVNTVHREEGRVHEDSGVSEEYARSYFRGLGYKIESYGDRYHWALIAEKRIGR